MNISVELGLTIAAQLITIGIFVGKLNTLQKMVEFRLDQLEKKQDRYNHLQERMTRNEESLKTAHTWVIWTTF
ncbi:hypothetical protein [Candidatus Proelusimicrobium excrementi]|uniref:hypothetical protein n=1 Tax=Candidatus Proelusimicrobium excrementi TaxID=3416222 RepID=UPI003CA98CAB|nr:hypothetical protein [Elusimicrobiaceae bacterium]